MKKFIKTALILGLICAVSSVLLALLNKVTAPKIEEYEKSKVMSALESVSCGYQIGAQTIIIDNEFITDSYTLSDNGKKVGYILQLTSNGYGGKLILSAGYSLNGEILAVKLVSDSETPGVGKKAENEGYMDKFIGKGSINPVPTSKDMLSESEALTVSGASITFGGISKALSAGSEYVKSLGD